MALKLVNDDVITLNHVSENINSVDIFVEN